MSRPAVSSGPVARFENDHGSLGRPPPGVGVELWIDRDPALPQPITLLPRGRARTHRSLATRGVLDDDAFRIECHVTSAERPRIDLGTDHPLAAVTTITLKPTGETRSSGLMGASFAIQSRQ